MDTIKNSGTKNTLGFKNKLNRIILEHSRLFLLIIYNLTTILVPAIFYQLIPVILNYPKDFIEASRDLGMSYGIKQILICSVILLAGNVILFKALKSVNGWKEAVNTGNNDEIKIIRQKCLRLPYFIYIFLVLFITSIVAVSFVTLTVIYNNIIYVKLLIIVFAFISLSSLSALLPANKVFKQILLETYNGQDMEGHRIGLKGKIFLQLIPLFMAALLLISLIGYSRLIEEKGDLYYQLSSMKLEGQFDNSLKVSSIEQARELLKNIKLSDTNYYTFIISPDNNISTSDGSNLSSVLKYYIRKLSPAYDGRIYDMTCETQGVIKKVTVGNKEWVIGIIFKVASNKAAAFFLISFISFLLINILILYYISKSLADDVSLVARSLTEIAESEKVDLDKKIPVTSNDEIGDLIIAFHKIQELERSNIKSLQEQQSIILEKERLASLGHMIGGIAHTLNTPIMSISGIVEKLKELVGEYNDSIGDKSVLEEDHKEIAAEMISNLDKVVPHCTYMSNIINTVKVQAVNLNESTNENFYLDEMTKIIKVLTNYKEKLHNCKVNFNIEIDENIKIQGEVNNIVQVLDNLILNAMESYVGGGGTVDFTASKDEKKVKFVIKDYGRGIPNDIKNKIFKQMITTKGKNGTGIGLYMSYSTIKGRFGGDIWFDSQEGKGSTFYITIPFIE